MFPFLYLQIVLLTRISPTSFISSFTHCVTNSRVPLLLYIFTFTLSYLHIPISLHFFSYTLSNSHFPISLLFLTHKLRYLLAHSHLVANWRFGSYFVAVAVLTTTIIVILVRAAEGSIFRPSDSDSYHYSDNGSQKEEHG